MAFWKKSEDPWDIDPDERRLASEPAEKAPGLLDTLRGDWDAMRAEWQEKREKLRLPPEKCPWCGKDMEQGFLWAAGTSSGTGASPPERRCGSGPDVKILCGWTRKAIFYATTRPGTARTVKR